MAWKQLRGSKTPMWFDKEPSLELKAGEAPKGHKSDEKAQVAADKAPAK